MPPEVEGGTWANFAVISSSMHEFSIDFVRMNGSMPTSGVVEQRINMSALLAQQLIDALQQNWQNYAAKAMPPPEIEGG